MAQVLTQSTQVKCLHSGQLQTDAHRKLTVQKESVLVAADLLGQPISGCVPPQNPSGPPFKPCTTCLGLPGGTATKLTVNTLPVLFESASSGKTDGSTPPTPDALNIIATTVQSKLTAL